MRLHIGCADKRLPSPWVNADAQSGGGADRVLNLADLWPLDAASCSWVYTSHTLEHIEFDSIPKTLAGLHRVLRPGGKLTIATIDIVGIYENRYKKMWAPSWNAAIYGDTWGLDRPFASHKSIFDEKVLTDLLLAAGFHDVHPWMLAEYPEIAGLIDCASRDRDVSLLLEALA